MDESVLRGELDGVGNQVEQYLTIPAACSDDNIDSNLEYHTYRTGSPILIGRSTSMHARSSSFFFAADDRSTLITFSASVVTENGILPSSKLLDSMRWKSRMSFSSDSK